jgi:hypothetical protein
MHNIDERIERLYREMKPLQELYGLKSKTIEQRYQEILAKEKIKQLPNSQSLANKFENVGTLF